MKDNSFGSELQDHRKLKNISQKELSRLTGLSVSSISKYESGERMPRILNAKKIAQILELDLSKYYSATDPDKNEDVVSEDSIEMKKLDPLYISNSAHSKVDYHLRIKELLTSLMQLNTEGLDKVTRYAQDLLETHLYDFMKPKD